MSKKDVDLLFRYDLQNAMLHGNFVERKFHKKRLDTVLNASDYSGKKILDFGCNTGIILIPLMERGNEVIGVDIAEENIREAKKNLSQKKLRAELIIADGKKSPFKENSFDVVLMIDILEHVSNPKALIDEVWKMLKDHGIVIVSVPWRYHPVVRFSFIRKLLSSRKTIDEAPDIPFTSSKLNEMFSKFRLKKMSLEYYYVVIFAIYEKIGTEQ